ncbi:hypothetical protein [Orf virus]|uniref:Protein OPG091 n=2 Tax=Orf virus TaxID=10258 RepID=Q6TW57_ORFV|nr:ORF043 hypothetical protein [Orf virus]ABA00560.1 hypothetical protein [Orf virus]AHH34232.1 hypothetical protein [Orf virus]QJX15464.1 hypothetical protein 01orf_00037 [Orf virus]WIF30006.1 hypothetical protein [Orf virus]
MREFGLAARMARAIEDVCPRGAVIFVSSAASMTDCLNPSVFKHAAIYAGRVDRAPLPPPSPVPAEAVTEPCAIDAIAPYGARVVLLSELLRSCVAVQAYRLAVPGALALMNLAADAAFELVGTPYGFNSDRTYCFKLVADCFASVGVTTKTRRIMGRDVVLSQDFLESGMWTKVLDSAAEPPWLV